jgi:hypothetical protein
VLRRDQAVEQVRILQSEHNAERLQLDVVRRYWKGRQPLPTIIDTNSPRIVKTMARIARVNICPVVIDSLAQSTFVDGFRGAKSDVNADVWQAWQANKMDARQTGLHRSTFAYGAAYAVVMPGDPLPTIRAVSPRSMTAMYGEDPDWPIFALERLARDSWKLYDETAVYYVSEERRARPSDGYSGDPQAAAESTYTFVSSQEHGLGYTPVVRYLDEDDLDCDDEVSSEIDESIYPETTTRGQIAPLRSLQDQIDLTTFDLLVAQHFAAFRQRYVIGWTAASEQELLKASAASVWTFADGEDSEGGGVKVGEFGQTDIGPYIASRDASLRHAATLSQTPVHELVGTLVNLSAEALAAAENGHDRKVDERKTLLGESHEQTLRLVGKAMGKDVPEDAEVIWRDTSARTFAATVDGLGKLATMLNVPSPELWSMIPGVTQQDVERWKANAQTGDAFAQLADILKRQGDTTPPPAQ